MAPQPPLQAWFEETMISVLSGIRQSSRIAGEFAWATPLEAT